SPNQAVTGRLEETRGFGYGNDRDRGMIGSCLSCDLFVNHLGNCLFCLDISNCFISGAESAYHGGITVELTSNFNCFHAAPFARQVRKLRPRPCPRALPSRRSEIFDSVAMNFGDGVQQFFKPQLPSARSDLSLRPSLNNLLNEFLIAQNSLVDRLV